MDQPNSSLDILAKGLIKYPKDTSILIYIARIHDRLNTLN